MFPPNPLPARDVLNVYQDVFQDIRVDKFGVVFIGDEAVGPVV